MTAWYLEGLRLEVTSNEHWNVAKLASNAKNVSEEPMVGIENVTILAGASFAVHIEDKCFQGR